MKQLCGNILTAAVVLLAVVIVTLHFMFPLAI
jgi:hypothetical protein